jgi:hypothetical protein
MRKRWFEAFAAVVGVGLLWALGVVAIAFDTPIGSISGRITRQDGKTPIPSALVRVEGWEAGAARVQTWTDRNGRYRVRSLPVARYQVTAVAPGFESAQSKAYLIEEAKELKSVDLELAPREPDFSLYRSRAQFLPAEKIRVSASGYLRKRRIEFALYRIELGVLLERWRKQWANERVTSRIDTSGYEPVREWVERLRKVDPYHGTFDKIVKIPPQEPGFYVLDGKAEGKTRQVWLFVTRLALVTKSAPEKFLAFVVDRVDNKPAADASVRVLDWRLWDALSPGQTGSDGIFTAGRLPGEARLVIASLGDSVALCHADFPGSRRALEAYLFTDRPVYRPGHTVYFKGIVRRPLEVGYELPPQGDFEVVARNPNDEAFYLQPIRLSEMGSFDSQLTLPEKAKPGYYHLALKYPGEHGAQISSRSFEIQEYRKPEYKVEVHIPKRHYPGGETITANVTASYYFGAPVAGAEVAYRVYSSSDYWPFEEAGDEELWRYEFSGWSEGCGESWGWGGESDEYEEGYYGYGELLQEGKATTNADGIAVLNIPTKPVPRDQRLTIEVDVTDASRKTISAEDSTIVTQGDFALGLRTEGRLHKVREPVRVEALAIDYQAKRIEGARVEWTVERVRWRRTRYTCTKVGGRDAVTGKDGKASFSFTLAKAGTYQVRAQAHDASGRRIGCVMSVWVTSEEPYFTAEYPYPSLELIPDKKSYEVGDTARVMINTDSPESPMLVTVERDHLYSYQVETTAASSRVIEVPIRDDYLPNVTVSACLAKGREMVENSVSLTVSPKRFFLNVQVETARKRYHPGDLVTYHIRTADLQGNPAPAEVTIGIVDEAIYAVRADSTPNIRDEFYGHRSNLVSTSMSSWEFYGAGEDKFAGVKVRKHFPDTAFWAAIVRTDERGRADVRVRLPDNITAWRATVRAHTADTKVGEARQIILARKDLMVRISAPRFFTQRDVVTIAGIVHNYTETSQTVAVDFAVNGAKLLDRGRNSITLKPNDSARFDWRVEAALPGQAELTLRALAGKASDGMLITVPVLAHGFPVPEGQSGEVAKDGPPARIAVNLPDDAMPGTASLKVWLTPSLAALLLQSLDSLITYPYGCIEQTLSSFVPAVAVTQVLKASGQSDPSLEAKLPDVIKQGLDRVCETQNPDGGWGWYLDKSQTWTTAHAVYALAVAQACGVNVPRECLGQGAKWLEANLKPLDIRIPPTQDPRPLQAALRAKAWTVHALALAGAPPQKHLDELFEGRKYLNSYGLALLALALHAAQDDRAQIAARDLVAMREETPGTVHWVSDLRDYSWLDSDTEATAFCLMALLRTDPMNPLVGKIARWLVLDRRGGQWICTKTTAAVLLAMAEYMARREAPSPQYTITVSLNGQQRTIDVKSLTPKALKQPVIFNYRDLRTGRNLLRIERQGGIGALYYTTLFTYNTSREDVPAQVRGIRVRRTYDVLAARQDPKHGLIYEPRPMRGALRAGEIVRVRLQIVTPVHYRYLVLEDRLPSGFEVVESEAVQLAVSEGEQAMRERLPRKERERIAAEWQSPFWHKEVHDDRVAFFATDLYKGRYRTTYFLRAEMPGELHGMPARMYPMYEPGISGNSAESRVSVLK